MLSFVFVVVCNIVMLLFMMVIWYGCLMVLSDLSIWWCDMFGFGCIVSGSMVLWLVICELGLVY